MNYSIPHSEQAERATLGSMILDSSLARDGVTSLSQEDFYFPNYRKIFLAIKNIVANNRPIDTTTVTDELVNRMELDQIGGVKALIELCEGIISTSNFEYYVNILKDKTSLRNILKFMEETVSSWQEEDIGDIGSYMQMVEDGVLAVTRGRRVGDFRSSLEIIQLINERIATEMGQNISLSGVTSGYPSMDEYTNGFQKGDLIILAARPSVGKTALALNFALNAAKKGGTVGIFSLEMPSEQLMYRMLSSVSTIHMNKLRTLKFEGDEYVKLDDAFRKLSRYNMYVDDTAGARLSDIQAKARKLKSSKPDLQLIVIDYLGLITMGPGYKSENRQLEVSEISRSLKALARELEVPIISLSQLSRSVEQRKDQKPMLSDLRDSGSIEQDADMVLLIYRKDYQKEEENKGQEDPDSVSEVEIHIAKHRNGRTGYVNLSFIKGFSLFEEPH